MYTAVAVAFALVLFTHSWLRYLVLCVGLWLLGVAFWGSRTDAPWSRPDERLHAAFLWLLNLQVVLGLVLYFGLSPLASAARANLGAAMADAQLRFWGVEHAATMLLAAGVAHLGRVMARRRLDGARHRTTFRMQLLWCVLTLAAIPWPGLDIGRPLFRL